jgi:DNA-directed RNA polymerase subunit E'/Rpb7
MRLSVSDIEKLWKFLSNILQNIGLNPNMFEKAVKKFIDFVRASERSTTARIKLRIAKIIDEIESKSKITKEDKIRLEVLKDVMNIISEEEKRIDFEIFEDDES